MYKMKHFLVREDLSAVLQVEDIFDANDSIEAIINLENLDEVKTFMRSVVGEKIFSVDLKSEIKNRNINGRNLLNVDFFLVTAYEIKEDLLRLHISNFIPTLEQMDSIKDFRKVLTNHRLEI
jgi:hypothetical protein